MFRSLPHDCSTQRKNDLKEVDKVVGKMGTIVLSGYVI